MSRVVTIVERRHAEILAIYLRIALWGSVAVAPGQYWLRAQKEGPGPAVWTTATFTLVSILLLAGAQALLRRGHARLVARLVVGTLFVSLAVSPLTESSLALGEGGVALGSLALVAPVIVAGFLLELHEAVLVAILAVVVAFLLPVFFPPNFSGLRWAPGVTLALVSQFSLLHTWAHRRDLRELEAAQAQLVAQDRLGTIGLMAAAIAHDLRNPLAVVQVNTELLAAPQPESERQECVQDLADAVGRINTLVADLGRHSRGDGVIPPEGTEVEAAAKAAARLAAPSMSRTCTLQLSLTGLPPVAMAEGRLVQALTNLLVNAAFAVRERASGHVWMAGRAEHGFVEIAVSDDGPGVPELLSERIFEAQFTTKPADVGSGLGLYVCRSLVEERGGTVRVERSEAGGARFVVRVPLATPERE